MTAHPPPALLYHATDRLRAARVCCAAAPPPPSTGNPDKRMWGAVKYPGLFTLLGISLKWAWTAFATKA